MITRRNLAEHLRNYQLRSERDWSSLSFWSSITRATTSRWTIFAIILLFAAAGALYFRDVSLSLYFLGIGIVLLVCCQAIARRMAEKRQKRILP